MGAENYSKCRKKIKNAKKNHFFFFKFLSIEKVGGSAALQLIYTSRHWKYLLGRYFFFSYLCCNHEDYEYYTYTYLIFETFLEYELSYQSVDNTFSSSYPFCDLIFSGVYVPSAGFSSCVASNPRTRLKKNRASSRISKYILNEFC